MSQGERLRQAQALTQVAAMQSDLVEKGLGGIITDASKMYNTLMDICRMHGLDNPAQYWIDPESEQAQQAGMMAQQEAQQQAAQQSGMQAKILDIEQFKAQSDMAKDMADYEYKTAEALLKSQMEEFKITQDKAAADAAQQEYKDAT
jgi:hypothetical protein